MRLVDTLVVALVFSCSFNVAMLLALRRIASYYAETVRVITDWHDYVSSWQIYTSRSNIKLVKQIVAFLRAQGPPEASTQDMFACFHAARLIEKHFGKNEEGDYGEKRVEGSGMESDPAHPGEPASWHHSQGGPGEDT